MIPAVEIAGHDGADLQERRGGPVRGRGGFFRSHPSGHQSRGPERDRGAGRAQEAERGERGGDDDGLRLGGHGGLGAAADLDPPAAISIAYNDADQNGLVDGTAIAETNLALLLSIAAFPVIALRFRGRRREQT